MEKRTTLRRLSALSVALESSGASAGSLVSFTGNSLLAVLIGARCSSHLASVKISAVSSHHLVGYLIGLGTIHYDGPSCMSYSTVHIEG